MFLSLRNRGSRSGPPPGPPTQVRLCCYSRRRRSPAATGTLQVVSDSGSSARSVPPRFDPDLVSTVTPTSSTSSAANHSDSGVLAPPTDSQSAAATANRRLAAQRRRPPLSLAPLRFRSGSVLCFCISARRRTFRRCSWVPVATAALLRLGSTLFGPRRVGFHQIEQCLRV